MKKMLVGFCLLLSMPTIGTAALSPVEELGKKLFFDAKLSTPGGQSCAACHAPEVGWTGPSSSINAAGAVYPGAVHTKFGNRKPPSAAYGGGSPPFHYDSGSRSFSGGMFWDGRATGEGTQMLMLALFGTVDGAPLADQAMGPFLNTLEQHNPNMKKVCLDVRKGYAPQWNAAFPTMPIDCGDGLGTTYQLIAVAIAAYEKSSEVNPYTSKYDYYLRNQAQLTAAETRGLQLFEGKAKCSACHPAPAFTDFTYDNLGLPKNPQNPFYGMPPSINPQRDAWVDPGLGGYLQTLPESYFTGLQLEKAATVAANLGKHKVPTLRNLDLRPSPSFTKTYGHNGTFKSLEQIVTFYNQRNAMIAQGQIVPEVPANINETELGNLGLTAQEEADLVAFLRTLNDGYKP
ncbi:cytochrome-c peroxidase [Pelotalea chapellei]|uniref:Cytochrome C n=1 Tax=Pelotalea chapellei TaxID=44671 RepID=A0ABS5UA97_9BACT|nr:cytochrome c peroxidase [Pelotalea chapellei]MBT1072594.1 cytochrome C [Pelotalea chapellei]